MRFANLLLTRRMCGRLMAGAAVSALVRPGSVADTATANPLTWDAVPGPDAGLERRYRATAQILVLSIPLVRWPNVGGGSAVWREAPAREGALRHLEFTGFSNPARATGLNRLGFLREISRESAAESLYFGLMTASPEETAEEARKALHPKGKDAAYTAIDGRLNGSSVETVVAHFTAPAQWSIANQKELMQLARAALAKTAPRPLEGQPGTTPVRPFLQTLAESLRRPGNCEMRFAYAGRFYRLALEKSADPKAAASYRQRRLVPAGANVIRATGRVQRETGGKESTFRVWVQEGAAQPLPLRIEYQARSYLRLIFEAEG